MEKRGLLWWLFVTAAVVGFFLILGAAGGVERCSMEVANASRTAGIGFALLFAGVCFAKAVS